MAKKLYPFSMVKNGHNIELAYNHQKCICDDMEDGTIPYDRKAFEWLQKLSDAYASAIGQPVAWVDWQTWKILQDANMWAQCYRDQRNSGRRTYA